MRKYWILLFVSLLLFSCKQEEDLPPDVQILSPSAYSEFFPLETIIVKVDVVDDVGIEYITIGLVDENRIPVQASRTFYPVGTEVSLEVPYDISVPDLSGGDYYLMVKAFDGQSSKHDYVPIYINALPQRFSGVMAIGISAQQTNVYKLDTLMNIQNFMTLNQDYGGSALNRANNSLCIAGRVFGNLYSYDIETGTENWVKLGVPNPPFVWYRNVKLLGDDLVVSYGDGSFRGYASDGTEKFTYFIQGNNAFSYDYELVNDKLFAGINTPGHGFKIQRYFYPTFFEEEVWSGNYVFVDAFPIDNENALIFYNHSFQAFVVTHNFNSSTLIQPTTLPMGPLTKVEYLGNGRYLMGIGPGLYIYEYPTHLIAPLGPMPNLKAIKREVETDQVWVAASKSIYIFDDLMSNPVNVINFQDTLADFHFIYSF